MPNAAEVARLKLPASTADYSKADWAKHNAVTDAWLEKLNEPPADGSVEVVDLTAGSPTFGQATITSRQEIDAEIEFDHAAHRSQTTARDRAPRRQSIGVRRRTCTGRRRPGHSAAHSMRGSPPSGGDDDPGGDPEGEPHAVPLLAGRDRLLADTFARLGVIA